MRKDKTKSIFPYGLSIEVSFQHLFSKLKNLEWLELVMPAGTAEGSELKFQTTLVESLEQVSSSL